MQRKWRHSNPIVPKRSISIVPARGAPRTSRGAIPLYMRGNPTAPVRDARSMPTGEIPESLRRLSSLREGRDEALEGS